MSLMCVYVGTVTFLPVASLRNALGMVSARICGVWTMKYLVVFPLGIPGAGGGA